MPRSMTGFGAAEGAVHGRRLRVEIRTVNHRYFSPQLKLPADLAGLEAELRDHLRRRLERGHVTASARWLDPAPLTGGLTVDLERAEQVVTALRRLKRKLRLKGEPDLAFVARHPDVLGIQTDGEGAPRWADVEPVVEQAAAEVVTMREREGAALAADLRGRLDALEAAARAVEARAPARLAAEHARLKQAVAQLAGGVQLDEQRLALEIALLADRVDIAEELVRLRAHLTACRAALEGAGPAGRRLGFLAQELLREVNTIGSKANDAEITHAVIGMKGELERFREQLENLE